MKTSEILNSAADEVLGRGWKQGQGKDDPWGGGAKSDEPVCLEGGIMAAMGLSTDDTGLPPWGFTDCPAYRAVEEYLYPGRTVRRNVFHWNDRSGRTAEEVIEVLRAAALIEEAKENAEVKVLEPVR